MKKSVLNVVFNLTACFAVGALFAACDNSSTAAGGENGGNGGGAGADGGSCLESAMACPETLAADQICDSRDGQVYKVVTIGNQTWTAQSANYCTGTSWCYNNDPANCIKYGRLYNWESAKNACPEGYHLSSNADWIALEDFITSESNDINPSLRSKETWTGTMSTPGYDLYGFNALAGGENDKNFGFRYEGDKVYFWTSEPDPSSQAQHPTALISFLSGFGSVLGVGNSFTDDGLYVRCVKD